MLIQLGFVVHSPHSNTWCHWQMDTPDWWKRTRKTVQLMSRWPQDRERYPLSTGIKGPCCSVMCTSRLQVMCLLSRYTFRNSKNMFLWEDKITSWRTYKMTIGTEACNFLPSVSGPLNATCSWKQMIDLVITVFQGFQLYIKSVIEFPFRP